MEPRNLNSRKGLLEAIEESQIFATEEERRSFIDSHLDKPHGDFLMAFFQLRTEYYNNLERQGRLVMGPDNDIRTRTGFIAEVIESPAVQNTEEAASFVKNYENADLRTFKAAYYAKWDAYIIANPIKWPNIN